MTWSKGERLYDSLPAIYRVRDVAQGEPLRALLSLIEGELETVEADIDGLYDDWFIETSSEWVVSYIGDLLGVRPLHTVDNTGTYSLRAYVANTLRYRRRKGTAAVLEQLARDVTGWPARAVEFFQQVATTQHMNHVRLHNLRTPDLRDTNQLELLGTPFEQAAYTVEVRRIASGRGKYNIPNVGIFLWRLQSYLIQRGTARPVSDPPDGRYTFNPVGIDAPLFNRPRTEPALTQLAEEVNVPDRLRRRPLYDELEALRRALVDGGEQPKGLYFAENPVVRVFANGAADPIPFKEMLICDLHDVPNVADWRRPPDKIFYTKLDTTKDPPTLEEEPKDITVAVDPVRGRLAFPPGEVPTEVDVTYAYGFSGDVGGGSYPRQDTVSESTLAAATWQVQVGQQLAPVAGAVFNTLSEAVEEWNDQQAGTVGMIDIRDSRTYEEDLTIEIPEGSQLIVTVAIDQRPHVLGDIMVRGTAGGGSDSRGEMVLDGLLVEGSVNVLVGNLGSLRLAHSTLVPDQGGLKVNASISPGSQNSRLRISIIRSIVGPVDLPGTVPELYIQDSIVEGQNPDAIKAPGATTDIQTSSIFGPSSMRSLNASECIFMDPVLVERRQIGCIRFSYVPEGSRTPRCHRCQPNLALQAAADPDQQASIRKRLTPQFTSTAYGDPAYAQLGLTCAPEISTGAEDGSEMGVFSHLKQPQREINLHTALDEYLRFGLEAGIFYVT